MKISGLGIVSGKMLAWPSLQSLAVKNIFYFLQSLGGEKLLRLVESAGEKIKEA